MYEDEIKKPKCNLPGSGCGVTEDTNLCLAAALGLIQCGSFEQEQPANSEFSSLASAARDWCDDSVYIETSCSIESLNIHGVTDVLSGEYGVFRRDHLLPVVVFCRHTGTPLTVICHSQDSSSRQTAIECHAVRLIAALSDCDYYEVTDVNASPGVILEELNRQGSFRCNRTASAEISCLRSKDTGETLRVVYTRDSGDVKLEIGFGASDLNNRRDLRMFNEEEVLQMAFAEEDEPFGYVLEI